MDDILAGKKSVEEIECMTDSMEELPAMATKKMNTKTSSMSTNLAAAYEDEEKDGIDEIYDFCKKLYTKYDHDFSTYHVGNRLNRNQKPSSSSQMVAKSRKAPFSLAELATR